MRLVMAMLVIGVSLSACDAGFEPASRVTGLRLLAVQANHASAVAGQEVTLEALVHDPEGRSLAFGYAFCDSRSSSAALDCLRALDMDSLVIAQDAPHHVFTMPEPGDSGARDSAVGIAVIVCPGQIVPGVTLGIPVACEVEGEPLPLVDFEIGVKRVFFTGEEENQNPRIAALRWDGEPWLEGELKQAVPCDKESDDVEDCKGELRHRIDVESPDAVERFVDSRGEQATEQAVVQFYGTGGSFEWSARVPSAASTRWVARRSDAEKTLTLFFVVRDSRGGVSWQTREVEVLPLL